MWVYLVLYLAGSAPSLSQEEQAPRLLASIELHTTEELYGALRRARQLVTEGVVALESSHPVVFVLHGPEVRALLRPNYLEHRELVDLAASLSALGVVNIQACETWMGGNLVNPSELHSFIDTVPYGPAEERRLLQEGQYLYF